MPRKGKGGSRQGTPGTAYANRTDLNSPISTVPNQEYGKATEQRQAQQAVPMGESPVSTAPAPSPMPASRPLPKPGELPHLDQTNRPEEPVTTGLPFGAGAGPEVFQSGPSFSDVIKSAARGPEASSLSLQLANVARSLGL